MTRAANDITLCLAGVPISVDISQRPGPFAGGAGGLEAVAALAGPLNQGRLLQLAKPIIDPGLLAAGGHQQLGDGEAGPPRTMRQ